MTIRTTEQLIGEISGEISWRRKELTDLRYLVQGSTGNHTRRDVMTRAGVALLYAHWEGFVKAAAETYLEFVCMQRCKNSELSDHMLAIMVRSKLRAGQLAKSIGVHLSIVDFFRTQMEQRGKLPYINAIRTEANLSSTVLLEILSTLGLDTSMYEPKSRMIDEHLLAKRNHIAHGSALDVEVDDYLRLHDDVLSLMSLLRDQIENAAVMRQFVQEHTLGGTIGPASPVPTL